MLDCFTNEEAHRILREGLPDSPFNGQIQSIGPVIGPIETKIVTFPDKEQHHFPGTEDETTQELLYLNGFSSLMNIQIEALKRFPHHDLVIYRPIRHRI